MGRQQHHLTGRMLEDQQDIILPPYKIQVVFGEVGSLYGPPRGL